MNQLIVSLFIQHLLKQYALSQEPARKEFLDNLFAFLSKEGTYSSTYVCVHVTCVHKISPYIIVVLMFLFKKCSQFLCY